MYEIPAGARTVLSRLHAADFEAYLVGGCVRDLLRGVEPHDWDICTDALPEEVERCLAKCRIVETGLRHGTVTVLAQGEGYEVTTYRTDGTYSDGRRPDSVSFVRDLTQDLARRDFTMNAIAMGLDGALRDPFGGQADIRARVVRCVGDPKRRFHEDGLRVMRALRFASTLGYGIAPDTAREIHAQRDMLRCVAPERIRVELGKLLTGPSAGSILRAYADVLCVFWPELACMQDVEQRNPWRLYDVFEHAVRAVECAPQDEALRLTMLLHDIGKPRRMTVDAAGATHFYRHPEESAAMADAMLRRLKYDNATREQVVELIACHGAELSPAPRTVRRWLARLGSERFFQLLEVQRADALAQNPERARARLDALPEIARCARACIDAGACLSLRGLAVGGRDILALGVSGPAVGAVLRALLDRVIDGELPNDRETLLQEAARILTTDEGRRPHDR
ncbi:MAG TPA: HD domain-containing protein [Candidatus Onthenecus intestinigallinarum]|uniref:HD domain-containing protein n=1 Tax=Candidatus Onthenecus intestinigallinarum TaxID=2840875 RepID=A0A9D0ZAZ5_9FIRM|nr:HD domain-containing protein [Candidatus Onthenecus intestinigallinarum]